MSDLADARARFREAALSFWVSITAGDPDAANEETELSDEIVGEWERDGRLSELLCPLLRDEDPEIRFAAASYLLERGHDEAVPVLEALASESESMVGPAAQLRLMTRRST